MPWDVEDIRNIVRGAGLIALAFSAGLWSVQAIESNYHPTARPAPIYRTSADDRAAWVAAHTMPQRGQITATRKPKPTPGPKQVPLSEVKFVRSPRRDTYVFEVHLYKGDEWFETQIPISAGTQLDIWNSQAPYRAVLIKVMIGDDVINTLPDPRSGLGLRIFAVLPDTYRTANPVFQYAVIPLGIVRTVKLKLSPDYTPNDTVWRLDVAVNPTMFLHKEDITPSLAREEAALEEWARK